MRLDAQAKAEAPNHAHQRIGAGRALAGEGLVEALARQPGVLRQLGHALGAGNVPQGSRELSGVAVHTGARIASLADAGEVLVSSTVKDLVAGSGLTFEDRGRHPLKGLPGEWHLYAVASG